MAVELIDGMSKATWFARKYQAVKVEVQKVIVGHDLPIDQAFICLFAGGHVFFRSLPGMGKTTLAFTLGYLIKDGVAGWFQGTSDLLPMDIIGSKIWDPETKKLVTAHGALKPNFNVFLLDEVNRLTPKTASAFLSVMQEFKVNIQGESFDMADPFLSIGTLNPIEQEGTYALPEALLDRVALIGNLTYLSREDEIELARRPAVYARRPWEEAGVEKVLTTAEIRQMRDFAKKEVTVSETITGYIVDLVRATRPQCEQFRESLPENMRKYLAYGASPRCILWLNECCKAYAAMQGRDYVVADDVKVLAPACIGHRLTLSANAGYGYQGNLIDDLVQSVIEHIPFVS